MPNENKSEWSTLGVIVLCLLASASAFYGGSRFDFLRASSAQPATHVDAPKTEPPQVEQVKRVNAPKYFEVAQIIEGNVVRLDDGTEVNLIGVSCPKFDDADPLQVALAHEAFAFTTGVVAGKRVRLEYEPTHLFDGRERTLAYVYLQDGTLLNAELIKHGYGTAFAEDTHRFIDDFRRYELEARRSQLGQWESRQTETAQIESRSEDSIDNQSSSVSSDSANNAAQGFNSTDTLGTASRPRVVQPITPPSPIEQDDLSLEQSPASNTSEPSRSYSSPSYISPGIGPSYKPIVAENGSTYGEISERTGRPKTVYVRGYTRRDGTYVRSYWRSAPR